MTPLMVAATGRSGTTTMMQLLGSAPQVVFDRVYAYENAYLSYFLSLASVPLQGARSKDAWRRASIDGETYIERHGLVGGFPWNPGPSVTTAGEGLADELLTASWSAYVSRATVYARELGASEMDPLYYAETAPLWVVDRVKRVLGGRSIVLVRDPRDQFLSIMAFNRKRGRLSFGVQPTDTPETYAVRLAERQKPYLRRALATGESATATVVRFEELVEDRGATASRLSDWLGVALSDEVEVDHRGDHTTSDPSDGPRWRSEMDPHILEIFRQHLYDEISAMGWGW
jgi:hypothetical protein